MGKSKYTLTETQINTHIFTITQCCHDQTKIG